MPEDLYQCPECKDRIKTKKDNCCCTLLLYQKKKVPIEKEVDAIKNKWVCIGSLKTIRVDIFNCYKIRLLKN
jgi:hypothetical protein